MHKTLLLCFIHGFKGDDDTFAGFPRHLQALLSHALPQISVRAITYPKFETRGDLTECVARFRDWLQNQVIDLEVAAGTPSPTIDPSVHVVLVGHSMGGIVAAETLLAIVGDEPVRSSGSGEGTTTRFGSASTVTEPTPSSTTNTTATSTSVPNMAAPTNLDDEAADGGDATPNFLFPYIAGVLAFDTPYLGISPGVLAYGAESHYRNASSAYSAISSAASAFGFGGGAASSSSSSSSSKSSSHPQKSLTAGPESAREALNASADAAAAPAWQKWGRYAMFAGAAGAVVAGGAAAYMNRGAVKEGWGWVGGHLEFVGCLVRGEDLKRRVGRVVEISRRRGIGFADLVTVLGKGASRTEGVSVAGGWVEIGGGGGGSSDSAGSGGRTFCALPRREEWKGYFELCVNDRVAGEIDAHTSMFLPGQNPGFYALADKAKDRIAAWIDRGWYSASEKNEGASDGMGDDDNDNNDGGHAGGTNGGGGGVDEEPVLVD